MTVSMPLGEFKQAITLCDFSYNRFVEDLNIDFLAVNSMWSGVPLFSTPAKTFPKNIVAVVNLGSSGVV